MVTIPVITSDKKIWFYEDFLLELGYSMLQKSKIVLDLNSEGPDISSLELDNLLFKFSKKYNYDLSNLTVNTCNVVQAPVANLCLNIQAPYHHVSDTRSVGINYPVQKKNIKKHFGNFIGRGNSHRLKLATHLNKNHRESTLQTYHYDHDNEFHRNNIGIEDLMNLSNSNQASDYAEFLALCPIKLPNETVTYPIYQHEFTDLRAVYLDFFIEIVCETYFTGNTFFPTEKIWRPMTMKTPFIVQGPQFFLHRLRNLGFKTFEQWWDEGYAEDSPDWQLEEISKVIDSIATKSVGELESMYADMQSTLEHNYQRFFELTTEDFQNVK